MKVHQIVEADPTFNQGKTTSGGLIVPDDFKTSEPPKSTSSKTTPAAKVTTGPSGIAVSSIDADGKLSGKFPDGKPFKGLSPEDLRAKTPGHLAKSRSLLGKIGATLKNSKAVAALSVIFGAIQVGFIIQDRMQKTAEVTADLESWRFIDPKQRELYFQTQIDKINHAAYTNITVQIATQLVATLKAGHALAKIRGAFVVIGGAQATTGIGIFPVIAEYLAIEGGIFVVTWAIKNYGEEIAAWMWETFWKGVVNAAAEVVGINEPSTPAPDASSLPTAQQLKQQIRQQQASGAAGSAEERVRARVQALLQR